MTAPSVLIAGESWVTHSIHQKGFDSFTTTEYVEGVGPLRDALTHAGFAVTYQPCHVAAVEFPDTADALSDYDAVILSDIGANTLQLHPDTFVRSRRRANRLEALAEYVRRGGGLLMVGGYLTFAGIEGKGRWHGTPVEDVLPVFVNVNDDRIERPEGARPELAAPDHPAAPQFVGPWPDLLGYNRVSPKPDATIVATVGGDPLIVVRVAGAGRTAVFTSDCAPHWAPPEFLAWPGYAPLWAQLVGWITERHTPTDRQD